MKPEREKLQTAPAKFVRKGFPSLCDALVAVADTLSRQAKTGLEKRAIILISDGYDSESKTKFQDALNALQQENILLYALQVSDRTRGALLRDRPKPPAALDQLTKGTGGGIFPIEKTAGAAKKIADQLRKKWYKLGFSPPGVYTLNTKPFPLLC